MTLSMTHREHLLIRLAKATEKKETLNRLIDKHGTVKRDAKMVEAWEVDLWLVDTEINTITLAIIENDIDF